MNIQPKGDFLTGTHEHSLSGAPSAKGRVPRTGRTVWKCIIALCLIVFTGSLGSGCSTDAPFNIEATGASNELAITYRYIESGPVDIRQKWKVWEKDSYTTEYIKRAFSPADITIALIGAGGVWLQEGPVVSAVDCQNFYFSAEGRPLANYPYLVVGADAFIEGTTISRRILGVSPNQAWSPGSPMGMKWSFIFRGHIGAYGDWVFPHTIMHELGHVRGQLRHPYQFPDEHITQTDIQYGRCAMHVLAEIEDYEESEFDPSVQHVRGHMGFCGAGRDAADDPTTCIQYLKASNGSRRTDE